ncbi:hypothetical protein BV898_17252 [Hypsibius exemplaris]|uniref:Uncharacterized protein n=1 Tax=Hypsibius exemplaris TaxID=2072580 RepID=A0A9X6NNB3_HYPEX|nr:hypothetical protein BV898_17252 [Hypsibius exemplaris]
MCDAMRVGLTSATSAVAAEEATVGAPLSVESVPGTDEARSATGIVAGSEARHADDAADTFVRQQRQQVGYTWDCWKAILRDDSSVPSHGRLLRDVALDPRIKRITIDPPISLDTSIVDTSEFPLIVLENVWDESFVIKYVHVPGHGLAAHAVRVPSL